MFSQESKKLAVLESKLNIYEDLSREMLMKLESAVDKISEGNSRIATILAKHDQQIEQSNKSDQLIIKMIDEMKEYQEKEQQNTKKRFEKIEDKIDGFMKFRWQISGISAIAVIIIGIMNAVVPSFLSNYSLTSPPQQDRIVGSR